MMKQTVEKAAREYAWRGDMFDLETAFKAGAEWQVKQSPWISVEERLPEPGKEILLYDKDSIRHYVIGWLREEKGHNKAKWSITNGYVADESITHWMPIPSFDQIIGETRMFY